MSSVDENYELESMLSGGASPSYMNLNDVASGGFNWGASLTKGIDTGLQVFKDIYGGVQPGTFIKTPQGGIIQRLPEGSNTVGFSSFPSVGSSSVGDLILWGALGIGGLVVLSKVMGGSSERGRR